MRLVFAGSSDFALPALQSLMQSGHTLLVLSQPDKQAGRKLREQSCPVAEYARKSELELWQPNDANLPGSLERIRKFAPELIVTASYGGMLRRELRRIPPLGAINLHPSLLPLYRGATPIQSALLNGDTLTGNTIFRLSAKMDAGAILAQQELPIADEDNYTTLHDKLAAQASSMLLETLPALRTDEMPSWEQNHSKATYTAKLSRDDLQLGWNLSARQVCNRIRAFALSPGANTLFRGKPLKILNAQVIPQQADGHPGTFARTTDSLHWNINCADLQLALLLIQPAGKKQMPVQEYLRGARLEAWESFAPTPIHPAKNPSREES